MTTIQEIDKENAELCRAYELVLESKRPLFITGRAGTGKSTFLRFLRENLNRNFITLAPTGIAAINVQGVTIHSFFGLPLRPIIPNDPHIRKYPRNSEKGKLLKKVDAIIIDEVSMVRADLLDAIDSALRKNLNPRLPFGGKQLIMIGDVYQLEPIHPAGNFESEVLSRFYNSHYFFDANVFSKTSMATIELQKVYRQKDEDFIYLLDKVRNNNMNMEDFARLNECCMDMNTLLEDEFVITLCSTNKSADFVNHGKLGELPGKEFTFSGKVDGKFDKGRYPADLQLSLKEGAQVMFVRNDSEKRWVNGTIAKVNRLDKNFIEVIMDDGIVHEVIPEEWKNISYTFNHESGKIVENTEGTYTQFPLKLAWAITIHKSQGLTFKNVIIDLGYGAFAGGQTYVALSRCTSLQGIRLKKKIKPSDIFIDDRIIRFAENFKAGTYMNGQAKLW